MFQVSAILGLYHTLFYTILFYIFLEVQYSFLFSMGNPLRPIAKVVLFSCLPTKQTQFIQTTFAVHISLFSIAGFVFTFKNIGQLIKKVEFLYIPTKYLKLKSNSSA